MELKPLTLELEVDDKRVERRLAKITKATERTAKAFAKLNTELAKHHEITINFELKKVDKKWYQFWRK